MKRVNLQELTVEQLVEHFTTIGIQQDKAIFHDDNAQYSRLSREMSAIQKELKNRSNDQRWALLELYEHPNVQVRLMAAKATLGVAPREARQIVEAIAASPLFPQAGDAGMCLWALDEGISVPK
jgi:Domain of unknown function (DUF2019)